MLGETIGSQTKKNPRLFPNHENLKSLEAAETTREDTDVSSKGHSLKWDMKWYKNWVIFL